MAHQNGTSTITQHYKDLRPGLRAYWLRAHMAELAQQLSVDETLMLNREIDRIEDLLWRRSMQGMKAEILRRREEAIRLYEQNLADGCVSHVPYDRLRVIYSRARLFGDAIRVCQAYLDMTDELVRLAPNLPTSFSSRRQTFQKLIAKLHKHA